MNQPKLKYARLCRLLPYVLILGCSALPTFFAFLFPIPDTVRVIVILGSSLGLLIYICRNFVVLMTLDATLALLACYRTARKEYTLPSGRTFNRIRRSILRYGIACEPSPLQPQPAALRYKFSSPLTIYSRGIERVVAAYEVDLLNEDIYRMILNSAKANSKSVTGKKKALFLDKEQRKQSLHRVTVIPVFAHKVDMQSTGDLYELVCKQCGDEQENCVIPCIVDLQHRTCVFNSLPVPYIGFSYAVKNRGIRIIKQKIFGENLNLHGNTHHLNSIQALDPEDSLWTIWKEFHHQLIGAEREIKRRFEAMSEGEIRMFGEILYLKWDHRGICQAVELDAENKVAHIESVTNWAYPKSQPVGKKIIRNMEEHISSYYAKQGYTAAFVNPDIIV